ncbi:Alpha/Beta hydrolase protein [Talaromyces proteolyticus]|uniref:Alpha/Beta hydrolase protein n=1 Tax=Talaromyces proteolyticus TaxID=1131652 RepID=A0AAD4L8S6_9EURO|nr:Alpha/Beta hydrolase protein [Talaromyces proteolyticus]KAH8705979.1 Alpha/Beta hydrolase protein [Talaromyces proteolyticus]
MDEKRPPGDYYAREPQRRTQWSKYWAIIPLVLICFILWSEAKLSRPLPRSARNYIQYDGEHIRWAPCGSLEDISLECSSIDVPMDQFSTDNPENKTFNIPLIRMRGREATQNLLLNPGGPGAGGFDLMYRRGKQLKALVGEGVHLLSFDPRGVNSSTPLASCYPDDRTRRELAPVRTQDVFNDSPEVYAWTQNFIRACSDTMGEYAKYINTPQIAADMNSILDALGQEDMAYWGFSYGSLLGQTYAGLFPERSRRIIIDGVINQFQWYEGIYEAEAFVDADTVLDGFFETCIKEGVGRCSLAALAKSKEELREIVLSNIEKLKKQPISVYIDNSAYGLLDYEKIWYNGVYPALLKPQTWATLADNLHRFIEGNATDAFLAYGGESTWEMRHESNEFITLNDGLTGPEYWPQDRKSLLDKIVPFYNRSLFGASQSKIYYMKQQWTLPRTHPYLPRKGIKTAHPLLILSTTYDPVCPLRAARSANEAFEDSKIVEVQAYGHCSVAVTSACLDRHLREFLYEGKLPQSYTKCNIDSPYFVKMEESGHVSAHGNFDNPYG